MLKNRQWKILEVTMLIAFIASLVYTLYPEQSKNDETNSKVTETPTPIPVASSTPIRPTPQPTPTQLDIQETQKVLKKLKEKPRNVKIDRALKPSKNKKSLRHRIPKGAIGFEVVNGKMIAFGDIVMGQAPKNYNNRFGAVRIPKPQYWDLPIPIAIDRNLPAAQKNVIKDAIGYLEDETALEFEFYNGSQSDYIYFTREEKHCYSYLGRIGGGQRIFLSPPCGGQAILHEIMHALGFIHEHSRSDRDEYMSILWGNIKPQYHLQYMKVPEYLMEPYERLSMDFKSVMIYRDGFFAKKEGLSTMRLKNDAKISPQQNGLSDQDLLLIERTYGP